MPTLDNHAKLVIQKATIETRVYTSEGVLQDFVELDGMLFEAVRLQPAELLTAEYIPHFEKIQEALERKRQELQDADTR